MVFLKSGTPQQTKPLVILLIIICFDLVLSEKEDEYGAFASSESPPDGPSEKVQPKTLCNATLSLVLVAEPRGLKAFDYDEKACTAEPSLLSINPNTGELLLFRQLVSALKPCIDDYVRRGQRKFFEVKWISGTILPVHPEAKSESLLSYTLNLRYSRVPLSAWKHSGPEHETLIFSTGACAPLIPVASYCYQGCLAKAALEPGFTGIDIDSKLFFEINVSESSVMAIRYNINIFEHELKRCYFNGTFFRMTSSYSRSGSYSLFPFDDAIDALSACLPPGGCFRRMLFVEDSEGGGNAITFKDRFTNDSATFNTVECPFPVGQCPALPLQPKELHPEACFDTLGITDCPPVQSIQWVPCEGGVGTVGFHRVGACRPLVDFFTMPTVKFGVGVKLPDCKADHCYAGSNLSALDRCDLVAGKWASVGSCWLRNRYDPTDVAKLLHSLYCDSDLNLCEGDSSTLCDLLKITQKPANEIQVRAYCNHNASNITFVTCEGQGNTSVYMFPTKICRAGFVFDCSPCLPYIEPTANALPYTALLISSVKDVLLILVGAWILSYQKVRRAVTIRLANLFVKVLPYSAEERSHWVLEWYTRLNPELVKPAALAKCYLTMLGYAEDQDEEDPKLQGPSKGEKWTSTTSTTHKGISGSEVLGALRARKRKPMESVEQSLSASENASGSAERYNAVNEDESDSPFFDFYVDHITLRGTRIVSNAYEKTVKESFILLKNAVEDHERQKRIALSNQPAQGLTARLSQAWSSVTSSRRSYVSSRTGASEDSEESRPFLSRIDDSERTVEELLSKFNSVARFNSVILVHRALDRTFTPQAWMLTLQLIYSVVFLIVCFAQGGRHASSAWQTYEAMYFRYVNSCVSINVFTNAVLRHLYSDDPHAFDAFIFFSLFLLSPSIVTHVVPGLVLYGWAAVLCIAFVVGASRLIFLYEEKSQEKIDWKAKLLRVVLRIIISTMTTIVLQTSFNYALLFYERDRLDLSYLDVMAYEYNSRLWSCFVANGLHSLSSGMQFLSIFTL